VIVGTSLIFSNPRPDQRHNRKQLLKYQKVLYDTDAHSILSVIWRESSFISDEVLALTNLERSFPSEKLNSWNMATKLARSKEELARRNSRIRLIGLAGQAYGLVERKDGVQGNKVILEGTQLLHEFMLKLAEQQAAQLIELVNSLSQLVPTITEERVLPFLELRVERMASARYLSPRSGDSGY
jgi:hypothetical protein